MLEKEPRPGVHAKQLMSEPPELIREIAKKHQIQVDIIAEEGEEYEHLDVLSGKVYKGKVPEGNTYVGLHTEQPDISGFYRDLEETGKSQENDADKTE